MASSGRSCRTFINRDPTGVGHRVPNRTFLPRCCPRSAHPQQARSRQTLRSVSSNAERAPVTLELPAAGRTSGGSKGGIILNVREHARQATPQTHVHLLATLVRRACHLRGVEKAGQRGTRGRQRWRRSSRREEFEWTETKSHPVIGHQLLVHAVQTFVGWPRCARARLHIPVSVVTLVPICQ